MRGEGGGVGGGRRCQEDNWGEQISGVDMAALLRLVKSAVSLSLSLPPIHLFSLSSSLRLYNPLSPTHAYKPNFSAAGAPEPTKRWRAKLS